MMIESLNARQAVPVSEHERLSLRIAAVDAGVTTGLYVRALLTWALDHCSPDELAAAVAAEQREAAARRLQASKAGVLQRWGLAPGEAGAVR
ncbi:hypothetical protein PTQ19_12095 [Microbacterium esteraromaticum]|uniref:hypothetical protein n=1 Tax=Microbacterium esteraromaticum TaxID=57043 RepID=UPI00236810D8|nr:hypothetical protein [Microbacterium esteraromaticum]WDH78252.1 hypothetical protein PTQ19_12095 [Microbacterium esteraromaticum]